MSVAHTPTLADDPHSSGDKLILSDGSAEYYLIVNDAYFLIVNDGVSDYSTPSNPHVSGSSSYNTSPTNPHG